MKKIALFSLLSLGIAAFLMAFTTPDTPPAPPTPPPAIVWHTWDEAVALNKTAPRKIMIDVFTEWCGWCKRMDKSTFTDSATIAYVNANFYAVKFDAEQKGNITFGGTTFKYVTQEGGRGVHEFAVSLLEGNMGYPSIVYLDGSFSRIMISPGYKEPADLMKELTFTAGEFYAKTTWEEYQKAH